MSNEYKISNLIDIMNLEEDQIDRLCAELPRAIKYAKSISEMLTTAGNILGAEQATAQILLPLTWIDDGETEITVTGKNGADDDVFEFKIGSISDQSEQ
jgi:hypothetical protein